MDDLDDWQKQKKARKACVFSTILSWLLSLAVLILTVAFPLFIIEIDTLNGQKIDLNDFGSDHQHLLEIRCFHNGLRFTGFAAEEGSGEINGITWGSESSMRSYWRDICIPRGLQDILTTQTWYRYDTIEETCNSTFMYRVSVATLFLSIFGICFLPAWGYSSALCYRCGHLGSWMFLLQGLTMVGLSVCIALQGYGNFCGEQGDITMHGVLLIIVIVCAATSSFMTALLDRRYLKLLS